MHALLVATVFGLSPQLVSVSAADLPRDLFGGTGVDFVSQTEPLTPLAGSELFAQPTVRLVRAQNPGYDEEPGQQPSTSAAPPTYATPSPWTPGAAPNPFVQPAPQDPFLAAPPGVAPPAVVPWAGPIFGMTGPKPFRFGWSGRVDVGYIPARSSDDATGDFEVFETDVELKYTAPVLPGFILSLAPQFDYRSWDGPTRVPNPGGGFSSLPGSVYRFGVDAVLQTPANAPLAALIAFNPSLNTDFNNSIGDDAWQWDGRGMLFWRVVPQWMLVGGAGYLDRVHDRVIPYAGFVFTPNDTWEFRILYPESRISVFLGNYWGWSYWLYARGEYHIEAYQIQNELTGVRDQVELEDYRIVFGLRTDAYGVSSYVEVGWVLGRDIDYDVSKATFHPGTSFIVRGGLRF